MRYLLVSQPTVDKSLLPLCLSNPQNEIQSGGYRQVKIDDVTDDSFKYEAVPAYSAIDLLVAGLEASRLGIKVLSLDSFFYTHRNALSEHDVILSYIKIDDSTEGHVSGILTESISKIKSRILIERDTNLLNTMRCNAPFTFRYIMI
jgi:hypothetical protein